MTQHAEALYRFVTHTIDTGTGVSKAATSIQLSDDEITRMERAVQAAYGIVPLDGIR